MTLDSLDRVIERASPHGFASAAALFRFANEVLLNDAAERRCTWVVLRAIDRAEQALRDAVNEGDDMNVEDSKLAALRLRLGISDVRDLITAGSLADDSSEKDTASRASPILREAAQRCYGLAFAADDAS